MDRTQELFSFVSRVDQAVQDVESRIGWRPSTPENLVAAHSAARGIRLFSAVRVLVRAGYSPEAAILCRSLLEEVFRLQELAAGDQMRRTGLALGHLAEAASYARRLGKASAQAKVEIDASVWETYAARVEAEIAKSENERGVSRGRFESPKTMAANAKDPAIKRNFFEMEILNSLVHGGAAVRGFAETLSGDQLTVGAPTDALSPELVLLQATDYVLQACVAVGSFFDVDSTHCANLGTELDASSDRWLRDKSA